MVIDPYGEIIMPGLASEPMYYAGAFQKYGIGVQVTRVGKYKSYVETFTRTDMSAESREQLQKLLDDIWGSLVFATSPSRAASPRRRSRRMVDEKGIIKAA